MDAFRRTAQRATGRQLPDYPALHDWSIAEPAEFWQLFAGDAGVVFQQPATATVIDLDQFPGARWFVDARLNFAENLLNGGTPDDVAIVAYLETGERGMITRGELCERVGGCAALFREYGVSKGDRVAGWLPNGIEAVVAMLATASLGAVWSSCSPDFGASGALDRFGQIEPTLLVACPAYTYNGKRHDTREKVASVAAAVPSIRTILWTDPPSGGEYADGDRLAPLIDARRGTPLEFTSCAFDDPLYILYSSGTTGLPKCIVHGIGGTLLQHLKEHRLHTDVRPGDRLFFFTTCGWMMWNWLVTGLASGATIVLFDGSPFHPGPEALLDIADAERITQFGASAKYIQGLQNAGMCPRISHDLGSIRCWLSTGSPLNHEGFEYVYRDIKADLTLASISGGTDIISCFVLGNPTLPVYAGEIQCAGLGMAVDVWDEAGRPLHPAPSDSPDAGDAGSMKGELVCTVAFPSTPIGFWNDPEQARFRSAYFERFPGVWAHGDFAELTVHGGLIIHGRSDAVLNPGGVRIGTAEIYRQVEQLDDVVEALCVGQDWDDDVRVVLFVVLRDGVVLSDALQDEIRRRIRGNASPRHVPARIVQVADVPRTMSGKIAELAVRAVIHGREVGNTTALANPEILAEFQDREELAS